ncbi:NADP-dependent oxidoreductase [Brevibacterium jeotgali]|uniref:NADPH:quinone reductase n=1 Tax=Brevibacterium jeotgali TaxID=1262550 RepID=A0A2H1L1F3_9MICO|nr:NADP-dependent oxidoreductase [Brevibacterium jeotgali]TWC01895.1 NADPH:quinone reductase-like Zn-dependent oxidoreductase [Brevibacterium jeotgali]SMY10754.1 NADPH:quinone reductase [Brevibacterium jeotgali]
MRIYGFDEYGGPGVQHFHEVEEPPLRDGCVRIRTAAAGVNPADVKVRSGARQSGFPVAFPMAMGREACGQVVELGPGAPHRISVGDRVFGSCAPGVGAFAETSVLDATSAVRLPPSLDPVRAACIPVAVGTAHDAIAELECGAGDTVLVLGAGGGVGVHAIQLARLAGARVLAVASAGKQDLLAGLGVEHIASGAGWEERVRELTAGDGARPVDAFLDCVGGRALAGGLTLLAGTRMRSVADPETASAAGGSGVVRRRTAEVFGALASRAAAGSLDVVIDDVVPFAEAARAVERVEAGHARGKTVVTFT